MRGSRDKGIEECDYGGPSDMFADRLSMPAPHAPFVPGLSSLLNCVVGPISVLRFWISEGLTKILELTGKFEPTNFSSDNLSREIGRSTASKAHESGGRKTRAACWRLTVSLLSA